MTRSELIKKVVHNNPHLPSQDVETVVKTVFDVISKSLGNGKRVELRSFGVFSVRTRSPRVSRNPRTGEKVMTEEKVVTHFKTGKLLNLRINHQEI